MSRIDWILFDLGGVLLEVNQARIFSHLQTLTDMPASGIEERLKSAPFFRDDFMVREFSPAEIARRVNEILRTATRHGRGRRRYQPGARPRDILHRESSAESATTGEGRVSLEYKLDSLGQASSKLYVHGEL